MRRSNPIQPWLRFRQFHNFTTAACLLLLFATVTVAEAPTQTDTSSTASAADSNPSPQSSVAREILEIQQELGGSIVSDRQSLRDIPAVSTVGHAEVTDFPSATARLDSDLSEYRTASGFANQEVETLRDSAWQLDQSAERLERIELYKQADTLRKLAQQFRLDARAIRAQSGD